METRTDRWLALEDLVLAALDRPADERARWLASATEDPALRSEALELAAAYDRAGDFLEHPAISLPSSDEPDGIGPYRVIRRLGSGGMGDVYLATRHDLEFERNVAVKVLAPSLHSRGFVRRFRAERQILARLDHPNIARLYEGGTLDDGRPYIVMEYVEGAPLHRFCEARELGLRERLELVIAVCGAVGYAHRNLVLHLDIKPENILVGHDGTPKLLDFGIAKLLAPDGSSASAHTTRAGSRPLTPHYASPEQRASRALTTASDVYSLGVVLYRLLSGRLPHAGGGTEPHHDSASPAEGEPRKPSACAPVGTTREPDAVEHRHALLRRQLVGDLDAIILKALRREPELRYDSVDQLADDLRRHLQGLPVLARRGTLRYRLGKLARRHKASLTFALLGTVLLVGFSVAMTLQAARLDQQRLQAEQERREAETISTFLVDLFSNANLSKDGRELSVSEVLDYGRTVLEQDHVYETPEIDAALRVVLARLLHALGNYDVAERLLQRSLAERVAWNGEDHIDVAEVLHELGWVAAKRQDYAGAEQLFERALAMRERELDDSDSDLAATRLSLAMMVHMQHGFAPASPYYDRAIEPLAAQASTPRDHLDLVTLRHNRARMIWLSDPELAAAEYETIVQSFDELGLPPYPDLPLVLVELGMIYRRTDRPRDAVATYERALRIMDAANGVSASRRIPFMVGLARGQLATGDHHASEQTFLQALELSIASFGVTHPETQRIASYLRDEYVEPGREADLAALERRVSMTER